MSKLTLSIDEAVVDRAKRYAKRRGLSVSKLVQNYLDAVTEPAAGAEPPVLKSLRGTLRRGAVRDYRAYLERKHR